MLNRNDPCWCGSGKKWKKCHAPQIPAALSQQQVSQYYRKTYGIFIKTEKQIAGIRKAGHLTAHILDQVCKKAVAGVTTQELNDFAHKLTIEAGAKPAPLGYGSPPFPKSICTSLNEVICHGIPDNTPLKEGDILNIDITCILDGFYGDCSRMVMIGNVSEEKKRVVQVSYECLMQAISIVKPGILVCDIGKIIEDHATKNGFSVVNQFVAHGVGLDFHEAPQIPHHYNNIQIPLVPGMTFTIEPMINVGVRSGFIDPKDHWTARTNDAKPSAQWEHTLLVTDTGYEILTPWKL
jgi:methionyl aminopeptidase